MNYLLYPIIWRNIFIPLIPDKYKNLIQSPFPILIGVNSSQKQFKSFLSYLKGEKFNVFYLDDDLLVTEIMIDDEYLKTQLINAENEYNKIKSKYKKQKQV